MSMLASPSAFKRPRTSKTDEHMHQRGALADAFAVYFHKTAISLCGSVISLILGEPNDSFRSWFLVCGEVHADPTHHRQHVSKRAVLW